MSLLVRIARRFHHTILGDTRKRAADDMARNIMAETTTAPKGAKSSGDWRKDQIANYVAHFNRPKMTHDGYEESPGGFEGPEDAFVWLGYPDEGNPWTSREEDPVTGKMVTVRSFLDPKKYSAEIGGIPVKWIAWDEETGCNVYQRVK
jgi:hypothetical protein